MNIIEFDTRDKLDEKFSEEISRILIESINSKGYSSILFSGGSTPAGLFKRLSQKSIDWSKVKIGLVDDRMVSDDSEYSNTKMIMDKLVNKIDGDKPEVLPLVIDYLNTEENIENANENKEKLGDIDVTVLGMGTDGHFASIFPDDKFSKLALLNGSRKEIYYTTAPSYPVNRITFSWPYLSNSKNLFLHITGKNKLDLISDKQRDELPIDTVLNSNTDIKIYWAP